MGKTFGENLKNFKAKYRLGDHVYLTEEKYSEVADEFGYDYSGNNDDDDQYKRDFSVNDWIIINANLIFNTLNKNNPINVEYGLININSEYYSSPDSEIEIMEEDLVVCIKNKDDRQEYFDIQESLIN